MRWQLNLKDQRNTAWRLKHPLSWLATEVMGHNVFLATKWMASFLLRKPIPR